MKPLFLASVITCAYAMPVYSVYIHMHVPGDHLRRGVLVHMHMHVPAGRCEASVRVYTCMDCMYTCAHVGELHARLVLVEEVRERAAEDALDGLHLVRGRVKVRVRDGVGVGVSEGKA